MHQNTVRTRFLGRKMLNASTVANCDTKARVRQAIYRTNVATACYARGGTYAEAGVDCHANKHGLWSDILIALENLILPAF